MSKNITSGPPEGRHRNKVRDDVVGALEGIADGARILVGGFGLCGNPEGLIAGVLEQGVRGLTIMSNNAGNLGKGLATWLNAGIVDEVYCSYIGNNEDLHRLMAEGKVKVTVIPQGTFVERMRAAGAGIPAFYTPTGFGTVVAEGKDTRVFGGKSCLLEEALHADYAFIRARQGDAFGNLRFWRTARNFSPIMAMAADTTIAEVDRMVPIGTFDPDDVHLPGIFVHRVVEVSEHEDPFEYKTVRERPEGSGANGSGRKASGGAASPVSPELMRLEETLLLLNQPRATDGRSLRDDPALRAATERWLVLALRACAALGEAAREGVLDPRLAERMATVMSQEDRIDAGALDHDGLAALVARHLPDLRAFADAAHGWSAR